MLPDSSYFQGSPPSATCVPPPVAVKNAAMPEPPARIRSARVPCGVSSTSSSPWRYWRADTLFFPPPEGGIPPPPLADSKHPPPPPPPPPLFVTAPPAAPPPPRG